MHNAVGLFVVKELYQPLLRIIYEGGVVVTPDVNEHYARETTFWFQFAGFAMISQGYYIHHMAGLMKKKFQQNKIPTTKLDEEAPKWFGYALTATGLVGAFCMPASGFHLAYGQGLRILWIHYQHSAETTTKTA